MASSPSSPPGSSTDPARWDPRVLGLVGLICSVFFLFSYFKILRRDCATLQMVALSRNPDQRRRINENLEDFSSQFHSVGLDSYVMHSLPIKQIKKDRDGEAGLNNDANKDAAAADEDVIECVVCLGEFEEGEWVKSLPNCSHVFHVSCIDMWFQTHSSCPLCRAYVGTHHDQDDQCSIPINVLLESLDREDYHRERSDERYHETQSPNAS